MGTVADFYRNQRTKRLVAFRSRSPNEDIVEDISCVAEQLLVAHSMTELSSDWDSLPGNRRVYWALMLDAVCSVSGISLEEMIERVRQRATADRDKGEME